MVCRLSFAWFVPFAALVALLSGGAAFAQDRVQPVAADGTAPAPTDAQAMPPPVSPETPPPPSALDAAPVAGALSATALRAPTVSYGVAARLRWVSMPKWVLNLFTKRNVPLSSWSSALELFRRKGEFEFMVSIGYVSLSPGDGNWLGRGHDAAIDTDYVQFNSLGFWGVDASFIWHTTITDWFGLHYGAGFGAAIMTGQMLRTSNAGCIESNAGNLSQCHPLGISCDPVRGCDANALAATRGTEAEDSPSTPHQFVDGNIPGLLPIVNVLVGVDFRLPRVRGWEAKLEGGFQNAFFLGGGVGYTF